MLLGLVCITNGLSHSACSTVGSYVWSHESHFAPRSSSFPIAPGPQNGHESLPAASCDWVPRGSVEATGADSRRSVTVLVAFLGYSRDRRLLASEACRVRQADRSRSAERPTSSVDSSAKQRYCDIVIASTAVVERVEIIGLITGKNLTVLQTHRQIPSNQL